MRVGKEEKTRPERKWVAADSSGQGGGGGFG